MNAEYIFGMTAILVEGVVILALMAGRDENNRDKKRLKKLVKEYQKEATDWRRAAYYYHGEMERAQRQSSQKGVAFASDTAKELVKFAMSQAHPDKPNGSNERFIRYREIYEKVCK